ncbi:MAG: hypothetical protein S4CHLAM102_11590 [Chlamydiia bacterium]|nr:hypothetical protein [Chlamydiia bacterium]
MSTILSADTSRVQRSADGDLELVEGALFPEVEEGIEWAVSKVEETATITLKGGKEILEGLFLVNIEARKSGQFGEGFAEAQRELVARLEATQNIEQELELIREILKIADPHHRGEVTEEAFLICTRYNLAKFTFPLAVALVRTLIDQIAQTNSSSVFASLKLLEGVEDRGNQLPINSMDKIFKCWKNASERGVVYFQVYMVFGSTEAGRNIAAFGIALMRGTKSVFQLVGPLCQEAMKVNLARVIHIFCMGELLCHRQLFDEEMAARQAQCDEYSFQIMDKLLGDGYGRYPHEATLSGLMANFYREMVGTSAFSTSCSIALAATKCALYSKHRGFFLSAWKKFNAIDSTEHHMNVFEQLSKQIYETVVFNGVKCPEFLERAKSFIPDAKIVKLGWYSQMLFKRVENCLHLYQHSQNALHPTKFGRTSLSFINENMAKIEKTHANPALGVTQEELPEQIAEAARIVAIGLIGSYPHCLNRKLPTKHHILYEPMRRYPMRKENEFWQLLHICDVFCENYLGIQLRSQAAFDDFRWMLGYIEEMAVPSRRFVSLNLKYARKRLEFFQTNPNQKVEKELAEVAFWEWADSYQQSELREGRVCTVAELRSLFEAQDQRESKAAGASPSTSPDASAAAKKKRKKKKNKTPSPPSEVSDTQVSPKVEQEPICVTPQAIEEEPNPKSKPELSERGWVPLAGRRVHFEQDLIQPDYRERCTALERRLKAKSRELVETRRVASRVEGENRELAERVVQLETDCAKQSAKVEKHKRRDQEARLRANALQAEVDELNQRPPIIQQVVVPDSCEVAEEALLYCPITQELPEDPVVLASAEEAQKMGFHEEGYNAFILERSAVKDGVKVKKAPRRKREMIQLTRMKKEGIAGDLSFARGAMAKMERCYLNLPAEGVKKILPLLRKVFHSPIDIHSSVGSRCNDLVQKTNTTLELVIKACLVAKGVDINRIVLPKQAVSMGKSHRITSLAETLLDELKSIPDQSALRAELKKMEVDGFNRVDLRYTFDHETSPLGKLMLEVEQIDEVACLDDPGAQVALIEQVREIFAMCSSVVGLAANLMCATHDDLN